MHHFGDAEDLVPLLTNGTGPKGTQTGSSAVDTGSNAPPNVGFRESELSKTDRITTDKETASWARARANSKGRVFPQVIAHRGYKAKHPENTLRAFQGAVEVGAHAIETDIHLSKDGVVVLSHVRQTGMMIPFPG
jgi:glycerophosphoryl diester phosphodiesterase